MIESKKPTNLKNDEPEKQPVRTGWYAHETIGMSEDSIIELGGQKKIIDGKECYVIILDNIELIYNRK